MMLFLPSLAPWYLVLLARLAGSPFYFEYQAGVLITWQKFQGRRLKAQAEYLPGLKAVKVFGDGSFEVLE